MGVIGMWTSAEHELSDPLGASHTYSYPTHSSNHLLIVLGPFWAWKVGPLNDVCPTTGIDGTANTGTSSASASPSGPEPIP